MTYMSAPDSDQNISALSVQKAGAVPSQTTLRRRSATIRSSIPAVATMPT